MTDKIRYQAIVEKMSKQREVPPCSLSSRSALSGNT